MILHEVNENLTGNEKSDNIDRDMSIGTILEMLEDIFEIIDEIKINQLSITDFQCLIMPPIICY